MSPSISACTVYSFNANLTLTIALIERDATCTQASLRSLVSVRLNRRLSVSGLIRLVTENGLDVALNPRDLRSLTPRRRHRAPLFNVQVAGRRLRPASRCRCRRHHRSLPFPVCKQSKRILIPALSVKRAKRGERLILDRGIANDLRYEILSRRVETFHSTA